MANLSAVSPSGAFLRGRFLLRGPCQARLRWRPAGRASLLVVPLAILAGALVAGALAAGAEEIAPSDAGSEGGRPNILFIFSDDHATTAIGAYGGRLAALDPTPNLDRLAGEGVRLTQCFVTNSICTPSRATVMTGQYAHRHGVRAFEPLAVEQQTLARMMKDAGYATAVIGKWHLMNEPESFDAYAVLPGQGSYFNPVFHIPARGSEWLPRRGVTHRFRPSGSRLPSPAVPRGDDRSGYEIVRMAGYDSIHADDALTDLSLAWLRSREDASEPFFLMHQFKGPHDNFENAERYDFLYEGETIPEPPSLRQRGHHGPIDAPLYGTSVSNRNRRRNMGHHMFVDPDLAPDRYTTESYQRYLKKYLRTVRGVDDNIGRLLDYLREIDQLNNTIVIYSSDQGFMLGEHDYIDKRWMYEESLRMPWIIRYPQRFEAGRVVDDIVTNVDFAPTLLELAGVGAEAMPAEFQGRSFVSNLQGRTPDDWPQEMYYRYWLHMAHHDNPAHLGIRTASHKLIFFYGLPLDVSGAVDEPTEPHWELYDLVEDPQEMKNVVRDPAYDEVFQRLKTRLLELREELGDIDSEHPEVLRRLQRTPR